MINVCTNCGIYRADKDVDTARSLATCPECGYEHPFHFCPLYLVGGASGTSKSTVIEPLLRRQPQVVVLEADILWRPQFDVPEDRYLEFHETWLRLAKNIAQNGRPVMLLGAGLCVAENIKPCLEARYFSQIRYLALTCDDQLLAARLRARPAWRGSGTDAFIDGQIAFNRWCRERALAAGDLRAIDTSNATKDETAEQILAWMK